MRGSKICLGKDNSRVVRYSYKWLPVLGANEQWNYLTGSSELLTWYLGNLSAFWACWARCDHVMDLELSSRKPRVGLIQGLAESLENSRSMRRTEWGQRDTELIFDGFEIGGVL